MSITRRITAAVIFLALMLSVMVACADSSGTNPGDVTTVAQETEEEDTRIYPEVRSADYDGYNFVMLHWEVDGWVWANCDMDIEEDTGEVIETALYKRNLAVEDHYNVDITAEYTAHDKIVNTLKAMVQSADDAFDVYFVRGCEILTALNTKCLYDMFQLEYVDWTNPWWDQNSVAEFSLDGKLFFAVSDIQLTDKMATNVVMFNKQVQEDFNIGNLYQLVYDDEWYYDTMLQLTQGISADLNGSMTVDPEDRFGIISQDDFTYFMLHGANGRYCAKDEDDMPMVAFGSERNFAVSEWIVNTMSNTENFFNNHTYNAKYQDMFANNQSLFFFERLSLIDSLRNMEADFGILPVPKYDLAQTTYGHSVSKHTTGLMCMPMTVANPERTGVLLEALASESKYTLLPAYYDVALKDKYTRDVESTDMLDIVFATRVFDIGEFFSIGGFSDYYLRIGQSSTNTIASKFASYEKTMNAAIKKIVKLLESMEA